jgi:TIR domain-containing protein
VSTRIPVFLSHSYRSEDRERLLRLWDFFWDNGFAFTVDPKSPGQLSIPHLELMMQRSACYVAVVPHRAEEERYRTSPYIIFEHNMAVRARKPLLVIAEPQVAGHPFDAHHRFVFRHGDPARSDHLQRLVRQLKERSMPYARGFDNLLGSVGVVLPAGGVFDRANAAIRDVLKAAGYEVHAVSDDPAAPPEFANIDRHDFFVIDIHARDMTGGLHYRFVPAIRLAHQSGRDTRPALPGIFRDDALEQAGESAQNVIWWSDQDQLVAQLRPVVAKMQRLRREFRSHEEGVRYFQSLGRTMPGPVFISNAKRQNEFARQLSRAFDLRNIAFFHYRYNNSIPIGTDWEAQLFDQLRSSGLFIQLVTADYWASALCRRESELAHRLARQEQLRIYTYFLDETSDAGGHRQRLQGRDLTGLPLEEQMRRIVDDLDRYLTVGEDKAS